MSYTRATTTAPRSTPAGQGREPAVGGEGRDAQRFKQTLKDARAGLIEAQYQVGLMHAAGAGIRKNLAEALVWITLAAERGHAGAQYRLGCHFAPEPGTAPRGQLDEARAMEWLYQAARQGHARAHHRLAQLLRQSSVTLSAHHEAAAASLGLPESQLNLAQQQLQPGAEAELRSSGRAWLRRAAEQGLASAQFEWGIRCLDEDLAGTDDEDGWRWLRAAAQQGWPPALLELHRRGKATPTLSQVLNDPIDASARHALGLLFEAGLAGLKVNLQQARHWYEWAAAQNWPQAHTSLGRLTEQREPEAALEHYRAGAAAGDAAAQHALARLLSSDGRSPLERLQSRRWLLQAADAGHPEAMLELACEAAQCDVKIRDSLLRLAARSGLAEAQYQLAKSSLCSQNPEQQREARYWLEAADESGHVGARTALGLLLRSGPLEGRNPERGLELLQAASEAGDPASRWNLALLRASGAPDVARDLAAALAECRLAADTGFVPALATMGVLCAATDRPEEAIHWWRQAARTGDVEAQFNLALALAAGRGAAADEQQAFDWMLQAAEAGLVLAQAELGVLYATGRGVACDVIEAHKWFAVARMAGSAAATRNAERSSQQLTSEQTQEGERRARSWRSLHRRHV